MLEIWLEAKDDLILGSSDYSYKVGITWPSYKHSITFILKLFFIYYLILIIISLIYNILVNL